MNKTSWIIMIGMLASLTLMSGCAEPVSKKTIVEDQQPATGDNILCVVHFKRNFLGVAGDSPIAVNTDGYNGAQLTLSGKLKEVTTDWVVIESNDSDHWIPRDVILYLRK